MTCFAGLGYRSLKACLPAGKGGSDDRKWIIADGEDGNYILSLNVQDLTIDIQKQ
jgi:hypothetical protein